MKVVRRVDIMRRDDPDWEYIMRHVKSLRIFIAKRPERREKIFEQLAKSLDAKQVRV